MEPAVIYYQAYYRPEVHNLVFYIIITENEFAEYDHGFFKGLLVRKLK